MFFLADPRTDGLIGPLIDGRNPLPYAALPSPPYRVVEGDGWVFGEGETPMGPGYFTGRQHLVWQDYYLAKDGVSWMSLMPSEIESLMPHVHAASGVVVVGGLGMGLAAYAIASKPEVEKVIVVERDPRVHRMFQGFAAFDEWKDDLNVEIVVEDMLEYRNTEADFLFVDIWPYLRMDQAIEDMKVIYRNVPAPRVGYWGQELDIHDFAPSAEGGKPERLFASDVTAWAETMGMPLIGMEVPEYPDLCLAAGRSPGIGAERKPIEEG